MLRKLVDRLAKMQISRDVGMLVGGLVGTRSAPFDARTSSHGNRSDEVNAFDETLDDDGDRYTPPELLRFVRAPAREEERNGSPSVKDSSAYARKLVVSEVRRETRDAVTVVLRDPKGLPIPFEAGQFFTISRLVDGAMLKRAYSASSSALDGDSVSITIKRVDGGRMSSAMNADVEVGHSFDVLGPSGSFTVPEGAVDLVLVGGGSGITPLMSIAKTVLRSHPSARVTLLFGNRSDADVIFAADLDELGIVHPERFSVRHVLERESDRLIGHRVGRLDEPTLESELGDAVARDSAIFFICGPEPVMTFAERVLRARGVSSDRIKIERFSSLRVAKSADEPEEVSAFIGGQRATFTVAPSETILDAALRSGVPLPFSCTVGGCGACRVRLLSGDVALDEPNCLHSDERREGYVLACVSRPLSSVTIEVE